jgi:hypothetical protein
MARVIQLERSKRLSEKVGALAALAGSMVIL